MLLQDQQHLSDKPVKKREKDPTLISVQSQHGSPLARDVLQHSNLHPAKKQPPATAGSTRVEVALHRAAQQARVLHNPQNQAQADQLSLPQALGVVLRWLNLCQVGRLGRLTAPQNPGGRRPRAQEEDYWRY